MLASHNPEKMQLVWLTYVSVPLWLTHVPVPIWLTHVPVPTCLDVDCGRPTTLLLPLEPMDPPIRDRCQIGSHR
jgi:hypothetical protein